MTRREHTYLEPWLEAGVGVELASSEPPHHSILAKQYLVGTEGGYALTERGAEHALRIRPHRTRGEVIAEARADQPRRRRRRRRHIDVSRYADHLRRRRGHLHSPGGDAEDV